jgi:hypothetical protein
MAEQSIIEPMIADLIEVNSGYTNAVSLKSELFDDTRNSGRMSRYRPIASHRQAFQKLSKALLVKDKRAYLLTGAYGTGKSHLMLMFANYMETPAGEKPMPEFFGHYAEVDSQAAEDLKNKRSQGRHLVALCEWGGKEDFDEIVLRAVDTALRRVGFGDDLDTIYLQAIGKITEWESAAAQGNPRFRDDFECELTATSGAVTVAQFKKRLAGFDAQALEEFKRIHQTVTTAPFTYDKSNVLDILTSTLQSEKFQARYAGIVVLFDEFGDTLEHGRLSPKAFQRFAELCEQSPPGCARLVFVATAHKNLIEYAKSYNSTEFRTASDRVEQVALTPDGVEDIIAAIVVPQKQSELWETQVAPREQTFDSFLPELNRLKESHYVFGWLKTPKLRTNIIENIYPMHPMATYCLLQLSRDVASNNRSVFSFFSADKETGGMPGSYTEYITSTPIVSGDLLNLYTADRLFQYFAETLKSDNRELRETLRTHIKNYENSLRTLNQVTTSDWGTGLQNDDPLIVRLMKLMLVYEIVGIPNRADNLKFGLYLTPAEHQELTHRVKSLVEKGVLYQNKDTMVYEFKNAGGADLDGWVESYIKDTQNHPTNLVAELNTLVPLKDAYLEAKNYNLPYSEDKRLERRIVRPADLEEETKTATGNRTYFERLEEEITAELAKKGEYEGIALYVACEKAEDITKAKSLCGRNQSERIVVAIPKQSIPLFDAIMELKALKALDKGDEKTNFTAQDKANLFARLQGGPHARGATDKLAELRDSMLDIKALTWHGKFAGVVMTDDKKPHDIANRVMEVLYGEKRNKVEHEDFNKLHAKIDKKPAIREAVESLADYTEPLAIDASLPQSKGEIRYLQKVLLNHGALRQVKIEGSKLRCEVETNPDKFADKLPALADMVRQIMGLNGTEINMAQWMRRYRAAPYGQGSFALVLSLAYLRRRFGDSIRFKIAPGEIGAMPLRTFEDINFLSEGQAPNATLSYRPLSPSEKALVNAVYQEFGSGGSADTADRSVSEASDALKHWWEGLPALARTQKLYTGEITVQACVAVLERINAKDAHSFLFDELPTAFGFESIELINATMVATIQEGISAVRARLDTALDQVQTHLILGVSDLFEVQGSTHDDIRKSIAEWYNRLDSGQKDTVAPWQNGDSRPLLQYLGTITDLADTFLVKIPNSFPYGNESVRNWVTDKTNDYLKQLKRGKALIEENRLKVEVPTLHPKGDFERQGKTTAFHGKIQLDFSPTAPGTKIYVTEGNANPTDPAATRHEVREADPLVISENKMLKYAAQDSEGNWSAVEMVTLTNADKKFEPALGVPNMITEERTATFVFPKDAVSLKVTCQRLFELALAHHVVTPEQMRECLEAAYEEATKP